MRPIKLTGQNRVLQEVLRQARKFEYPDLDTLASPFTAGGGGGAFSIQIAAVDGPDIEKGKADYVALGASDDQTIQAAADQLHKVSAARGGRILLGSGTFTMDVDSLDLGNDIILQGMGVDETRIVSSATSGVMIETGDHCLIRDLRIAGGAGSVVGIEAFSDTDIDHVRFGTVGTAVVLTGQENQITRCYCESGVSTFIDATATISFLLIAENQRANQIDLGASEDVVIANNLFFSGISANGGARLLIADNISLGGSPNAGAHIDLANLDDFAVEGNQWGNAAGDVWLSLDTCTDGVVVGNYMRDSDNGIVLDTCLRVLVEANNLKFPGGHGVQLVACTDCHVTGNVVYAASQNSGNTFDNFNIAGDQNLVMGNTSIPFAPFAVPRYGVNIVSGNDNAVYANYLGDSSLYGTADSVDTGTGTQTTPTAGVIGGQFAF